MYTPLPNTIVSHGLEIASSTMTDDPSGKPSTGGWSSLIGIITAIIGNLLISVALNTQRYAHLRLERENNGTAEKNKVNGQANGYGTAAEARIANARAKINAEAPAGLQNQDGRAREPLDYIETDALLPKNVDPGSDEASIASGETSDSNHQKKHYLRSPYWWFGISLMTIGEAGNFLAYGFAPASIVSPLGVVALISNCLIAPFMLHEQFRKRDLLGILIAVGGAVTVVLSAKDNNPKLGPDEIWHLITQWEFETYFGISVGLILILMVLSNRYGHKTLAIDIGLVGLFGGYTALSTKGIASLLSYRFWRVITFPITYLLVAVLVFTAIMQIKYVNRALQRFDSTQVIPAQFVTFTISVIFGSAILYRDFESTTGQHISQFVGGCVLTFAGVWVITSGRESRNDHDHNNDDDREEEEDWRIVMVDEEAQQSQDPPLSEPTTPKADHRLSQTSFEDSPASFKTAMSHNATPRLTRLPGGSSPFLPSQLQTPMASTEALLRSGPRNPSLASGQLLDPMASASPRRRSRPTVPLREASDGAIPLETPKLTSRFLKHRPSVSDMIPQAFTSPLSGGLSGVIADAQRRESIRLLRSSSNRSRSGRSRASAGDIFAVSGSQDDSVNRNRNSMADLGTSHGSTITEALAERRGEEEEEEDSGPSRHASTASASSRSGGKGR